MNLIGQHQKLLFMNEKYDTSKDIDTYMSLSHDVMCKKFQKKRESTSWGKSSCGCV